MRRERFTILALLALQIGAAASAPEARGQALALGGDPRVDPNDFEITVFASGLDFPLSMQELADGSLLVGLNHTSGPGSSLLNSNGALTRFVDADDDGVADGPGSVLFDDLDAVTSVRLAGDLAFVATGAIGSPRIVVLRRGATPSDPFTELGSLDFALPLPWSHLTLSLAVREAPAVPGTFEVFFNLGSREDNVASSDLVPVTGLVSASLAADSVYSVRIDATGATTTASAPTRIASGVRNAFGLAFDPATDTLYFQDNGMAAAAGGTLSADELNRIAAGGVGGATEDFGFPDAYTAYGSGVLVGTRGLPPWLAFQPIPPPDGVESRGAAEIAFAPSGFPIGLDQGLFVGFHGTGDVGAANPANPLVYVDLGSGAYFHFVATDEPDLGHPDGLLATRDSLYVADLTSAPGLGSYGTGAIYRIRAFPEACRDGLDNDDDGFVDWNGGPAGEPADPQCDGPIDRSEILTAPLLSCGLGFELALVLPPLAWLRGRRFERRLNPAPCG